MKVTPASLEQRALELVLHPRINYAYRRWQEYMASMDTWASKHVGVLGAASRGVFLRRFGIHESLAIYSGGLGILAGDHLKSALRPGDSADRDRSAVSRRILPAAGRQRCWQQESYNDLDIKSIPVAPAARPGKQVVISINTRTGTIHTASVAGEGGTDHFVPARLQRTCRRTARKIVA
ncbi:MAG: hypothetical protein U0903_02585 [Planctomycetales bacterium]